MKKKIIKLDEKKLRHIISESVKDMLGNNGMESDFENSLIPKRSEDDREEEERQFYEQLGEYCYNGLDCFNSAIDLINSPYGKSHEGDLKNILKNIKHICDRIENIWEEYAD